MARIPPVLLPLKDATLAQRWQLVHGLHAHARIAVEGMAAQLLVLTAALVRTGRPPFAWLMVFAIAATILRLRHARQFARAHAAFLAAAEQGDLAARNAWPEARPAWSPERWAWHHAAWVSVMATLWGVIDLCVLPRFDDTWLSLFTLLVQAGWLSTASVNYAASPLIGVVMGGVTMLPTAIGAALSHDPSMPVLAPAALVHFSSVARTARSQGRVLALLLEAESKAAGANARLRMLSLTDPLTQIANRRGFDEALAAAWRGAAPLRQALGLVMVDVDHFKRYNDHYGHPAGDACLARVAKHLASALRRRSDLAARYGGEEFAAILPGVDEAGGVLVAERLRQALAADPIEHVASPFGVVTVSIGVAMARPSEELSPSSLIARADAALYEAKRLGRDVIGTAARENGPVAGCNAAARDSALLAWAAGAETTADAEAKADANGAMRPAASPA